ncbi:TAXI family TRAP transporter solute-binding subunit [Streptomyces edwardsiae]|uniref:TAXI family TRAP transporter solute-binding subunit n=1 Tax=Streptomyces edwardsiae TaxID=3075527 RepID=A0ABU2QI02_9ACTN|nr:TAXI family TRAP transporter solute-binding subunit [Streptomyces sp. DSM 41635]MDT0404035.1 TAXI family TRAP transporter solute-binding subunit [Streptomyces sp. DSM 41635]
MPHSLSRIGRRRALRATTAGLVLLGILVWWLAPWDEEPPGGTITVSTGTRAGVYQKYGELLRSSLGKHMPDLDVRLETSDGSQENVRRVATGEADFAIAAADAVETYRLEDRPGADGLRGVARLYDDYVQLAVARDSGIHTVDDLRGKHVAIGPPKSGVRLIANRVLRAAGIDPETDIRPSSDGIDKGPERLGHSLDAFFWSGGLPTDGLKTLAERNALRFVPIRADLVAELHKQGGATRYYRATNMPASAYPGSQLGAPVPTMAVSNLLITRTDADPRLTEWLTRIVLKSRDGIGAHVHSAQLVDVRTAIYTDPLLLHEGARRYYRSVKP